MIWVGLTSGMNFRSQSPELVVPDDEVVGFDDGSFEMLKASLMSVRWCGSIEHWNEQIKICYEIVFIIVLKWLKLLECSNRKQNECLLSFLKIDCNRN